MIEAVPMTAGVIATNCEVLVSVGSVEMLS
jgi:hypothetical protein